VKIADFLAEREDQGELRRLHCLGRTIVGIFLERLCDRTVRHFSGIAKSLENLP
jgi:hypothetical protein